MLLAAPGGAQGTGRRIAGAFAEIGTGALPQTPWWPYGYTPMERYQEQLAAHPREARALVDGLVRHPDPSLRAEAVRAAGKQLHHWRSPSPHLWETVAAGLEDEVEVSDAALKVLARSGGAAAPFADRIVRAVARTGSSDWTRSHAAVRALVRIEDPRASRHYLEHFDHSLLEVLPLPAHWAADLFPAFRERLAEGPEARGADKLLPLLAEWGPAAAPAAPELAGLLDTGHARPAAEALGRIGPAASAAADALAALARGDTSPWRFGPGTERSPKPWQGAQTAAWAHWRITGDPAPAVAALLPELRPLDGHALSPLVLRAVRALGAVGPPAAAALPVLRAVLASERRSCADILWDEELCRAAREALEEIEGPRAARRPPPAARSQH
ncbi:hypothetical protein [Streptomyces sp. ICC1]|uniref:hypothetical protein n=1 Tax=Streptomyces sp. ICC1 TaxID=2099583 RepID=UPI000DC7BC9E|nr:hypothetical protein [Streptomyces sp. ICC1]AWZ15181.1 hypothetical protein DRB96_26290 [Streptomyces sp. ICC1]